MACRLFSLALAQVDSHRGWWSAATSAHGRTDDPIVAKWLNEGFRVVDQA